MTAAAAISRFVRVMRSLPSHDLELDRYTEPLTGCKSVGSEVVCKPD